MLSVQRSVFSLQRLVLALTSNITSCLRVWGSGVRGFWGLKSGFGDRKFKFWCLGFDFGSLRVRGVKDELTPNFRAIPARVSPALTAYMFPSRMICRTLPVSALSPRCVLNFLLQTVNPKSSTQILQPRPPNPELRAQNCQGVVTK